MRCVCWVVLALVGLTGCTARPRTASTTRITILGFTPQAASDLRTDAIDEFSRKTGIEVDMTPTAGTSADQVALILKLLSRRAASPDIYLIDVVWPGTLAEHFLDLTQYMNQETRSHLPTPLENATVDDRVVGLPLYMNTGMLYYRADLLRKYGYTAPPRTWEELARMARQIQQAERSRGKDEFWGYVWQGESYEGLTCNALEWQASFGGGHIIESNGAVSVNNLRTFRAVNMAASWVGSISPQSVLSYTESDALNVFNSGNAAFMRHWSSAYRTVANGKHGGTVGVSLLPAGPAGRAHATGGFHLAVSRYSSNPREAVALVLYLTGAEVQAQRARSRGYIPTYFHLYRRPDLVRALPQLRTLESAGGKSLVARPSTVAGSKYAEVSRAYYETVHNILSRKVRTGPGLIELERKLAQLMDGRNAAGSQHDR